MYVPDRLHFSCAHPSDIGSKATPALAAITNQTFDPVRLNCFMKEPPQHDDSHKAEAVVPRDFWWRTPSEATECAVTSA
jgi:hypothetical protein